MTDERRLKLAYGLLYSWLPDDVMRQMGFDKTAWAKLLPAARPAISVAHRVSRWLPHDDEKAAFSILRSFNDAISLPEGAAKEAAVANPDEVHADIVANKGGMPKVSTR